MTLNEEDWQVIKQALRNRYYEYGDEAAYFVLSKLNEMERVECKKKFVL